MCSSTEFDPTRYGMAAEYDGADGRQTLNEELGVLRPREVIVAQGVEATTLLPEIARLRIAVTPLDEWAFGVDRATKTLCDQLRTSGLHAFGLDGHPAAICAAGALVEYLRDTQKVDLAHVRAIGWRDAAVIWWRNRPRGAQRSTQTATA